MQSVGEDLLVGREEVVEGKRRQMGPIEGPVAEGSILNFKEC